MVKVMKKVVLLMAFIVNVISVMSQNYSKLEDYLEHKIQGKLSPGVQFVIADKGGILYEYNGGVTNLETKEKVSANTQFKMYSSTKMLTMLAIMQLVEQGKVDLDAPVSKYLNYSFSDEVTVRAALSHTAGFSRYPFAKEIHLETEHTGFNYSQFINEMIPKHKQLKYKPGTKNIYSNTGYLVLSAIVEKVSGQKYEEYVAQNIFSNTKLENTDYLGFEYSDLTATAYQKRGTLMHWIFSSMVDTDKFYAAKVGRWQTYNNLYMKGVGFGGGFANTGGLAKLYVDVLNHKVLKEQTLNSTFESQYYKKNKKSKQTLCWWTGEVNGYKAFHHAGGGGGYSCEIRVYPEKGIVRIIMMNKTQDFSDLKLFSKLDKLWLE